MGSDQPQTSEYVVVFPVGSQDSTAGNPKMIVHSPCSVDVAETFSLVRC